MAWAGPRRQGAGPWAQGAGSLLLAGGELADLASRGHALAGGVGGGAARPALRFGGLARGGGVGAIGAQRFQAGRGPRLLLQPPCNLKTTQKTHNGSDPFLPLAQTRRAFKMADVG